MLRRLGVGVWMGVLCATLVAVSAGNGADEKKVDPTGTWKWSFTGQNGQSFESTLKLKMKDNKLTGVLVGRDNQEVEIKDAKVKDSEISFHIKREFGGQEVTIHYKGKVEKDAIKGKIEFERDGEKRERDWEAKRATDKAEKK